jgi:hypothetical protein
MGLIDMAGRGRRDKNKLDERERAVIETAVKNLVGRFEKDVPRRVLDATIRECFSEWSDAKIKDFVPILAERCAIEKLKAKSKGRRPKADG